MRPLRKRLTRRRFRRIGPPTETESVGAAPPPVLQSVRCMCGALHEVASEDHGLRKSCATCRRRFEIQISYDLEAGGNKIAIHYLTDQNERTGETCVIGGSTTVVSPDSQPDRPSAPEPPADTLLKCGCDHLLVVEKKHYERRVRCPECGVRMMVFMLHNPAANSFSLQTFTLVDPSTGQTQILTRI